MTELRCISHLHAKADADDAELEVKCQQCSRKRGRPVFHRWTWTQILEARERGSTVCWPRIEHGYSDDPPKRPT